MNDIINFFCPNCRFLMNKENNGFVCQTCPYSLVCIDEIFVSSSVHEQQDKHFYDFIYDSELGEHWVQGLNRSNIIKQLLEYCSLSYRRERFFKRNISGKRQLILDLACGVGRNYLKRNGTVVGVDLSKDALILAKKDYDACVQSGVDHLPFPDNFFDYVISSDFFGHVRCENKDAIISEIHRVLKTGGKTIHVIENDSKNFWFKFAHKYPDLFNKYFIERIGGHVGLEYPSTCLTRWEVAGFIPKIRKKIWGTIWPIQDYAGLFDNEYIEHSRYVRLMVKVSHLLGDNKWIRSVVNILLNPINSFIELFTPLDNGQGLMIVCQKK